MAPQSKILSSPDKDLIIKWLTEGISVREVERRLAEKHPKKNEEHLRVSFTTIQAFKKDHLNLTGKVLSDIRTAGLLTKKWAKKQEIQEAVNRNKNYQETIQKIVDSDLDVRMEILKVFNIIESRLEALFDKVSQSEITDPNVEKLLQGYLDQFMKVLDQHKKYVEGYKEQVDVNVNVNVMTEQINILREAVRESLSEVDPAITMLFMGKLNTKMKDLACSDSNTSGGHSALLDRSLRASNTTDAEFE